MMSAGSLFGSLLVALLLAVACSRPVEPAQAPAAQAPSGSASAAPPEIAAVEASVIFTDCPKAPIADPKSIKETMQKLVSKCTSVPGGKARFVATFEPGGQIRLSPPEGQADGVVPICVLDQGLRHQLLVVKACRMEVEMDEGGGTH
jgi:hypothetical protein